MDQDRCRVCGCEGASRGREGVGAEMNIIERPGPKRACRRRTNNVTIHPSHHLFWSASELFAG